MARTPEHRDMYKIAVEYHGNAAVPLRMWRPVGEKSSNNNILLGTELCTYVLVISYVTYSIVNVSS